MKKKNIVIERFNTDKNTGLTKEMVVLRKKQKLSNLSKDSHSKSYLRIILENVLTFFNLIWAVIFVALLSVKAYNDLLFIIVIVLNTLIAIIQECKAKHTVKKLSLLSAPKVKVLRDGEFSLVSSKDIVLDDIIELSVGNQICADLILVEGVIEVNESLLTGESVPIKKKIGDTLLAGSFLTSGSCFAKVEKVGKDKYIDSIAKNAKKFKKPESNLFKDLKKLTKIIGIFLIPIGVLMFINNYIGQHVGLEIAITKTCGSLTGLIPAGMFLLVTIALAVGVIKLGKKNTLVQDLYSVEMLARVDVLCLDKTGTITDGTMKVKSTMILAKNETTSSVKKILSTICSASTSDNQTAIALANKYGKKKHFEITDYVAFSSDRKHTLTTLENHGVFALGAPEFIKCTLNEQQTQIVEDASKKGLRVLLLANKKRDTFYPVAFVLIEDHIRDDAKETIRWFKQNGVEIKVISGDNAKTVSSISKRVGIRNAGKYVSLENMTLEDVEKIATKYTVFGRVSPEQKHTLIKTLKSAGHIVAMTGDGVNDTLALKEANCSIAMADGSEVARNISNLVLMDSKFSSLPKVVAEGRQVINNIQKSSSLFIMKTLFTLALVLVSIASFSLYPFAPSQLFLLEFCVIGLPSFFLALQPNQDPIAKGSFLKNILKNAWPYALTLFMNSVIVLILFKINTISLYEFNTLSTLLLTMVGFLNLVKMCWPIDKLRGLSIGISATLICLGILIIPSFFGMTSFTSFVLLMLAFLACATIIALLIWLKISTDKKSKQEA